MKNVAVILIIAGFLLLVGGVLLLFADKLPWLGNLPGDIHYRGKNFSFRFPLMTCLIISVIITVIFNLIIRFFMK